jgi:hypothetical protein
VFLIGGTARRLFKFQAVGNPVQSHIPRGGAYLSPQFVRRGTASVIIQERLHTLQLVFSQSWLPTSPTAQSCREQPSLPTGTALDAENESEVFTTSRRLDWPGCHGVSHRATQRTYPIMLNHVNSETFLDNRDVAYSTYVCKNIVETHAPI